MLFQRPRLEMYGLLMRIRRYKLNVIPILLFMILIPESLYWPLHNLVEDLKTYTSYRCIKEENEQDHTLKYVWKYIGVIGVLNNATIGEINIRNCRCGGSYATLFQVSRRMWTNGFLEYSYMKAWQAEEQYLDVHDVQALMMRFLSMNNLEDTVNLPVERELEIVVRSLVTMGGDTFENFMYWLNYHR